MPKTKAKKTSAPALPAVKPMDVWYDEELKRYLHVDRIVGQTAVCGQRKGTTGRWTVLKHQLPVRDFVAPRYRFDHYEGPTNG